jgi:hypothetical protein
VNLDKARVSDEAKHNEMLAEAAEAKIEEQVKGDYYFHVFTSRGFIILLYVELNERLLRMKTEMRIGLRK